MKLRIVGPPLVARMDKPKLRLRVYPCNDMVVRSMAGIAKIAGVSLCTMMCRFKEYGPHDPRIFAPKLRAGRKGTGSLKKKKHAIKPKVGETDHERAVNAYITEAEKYADLTAGSDEEWNRVYCRKMNELTRAAGLRV